MKKISGFLMIIGGCAILIGALTHITGWSPASYIFGLGAVMFASSQLNERYKGDNLTIKRLKRQQALGAIFILLTTFLMFSENFYSSILFNNHMDRTLKTLLLYITKKNTWILTLSIGAFFELYSSFRISFELSKEKRS
ncbi:MAG TPA: hypothetical protein VFC94_03275 [Bacteroidaceae bacterium]|nr:hypothetical protein [Bacteroidaceae bacterium]